MADRGLTPAPGGDPDDSKAEDFERFMATSIRAFDAMMDAVKTSGSQTQPAPLPASAPHEPIASAQGSNLAGFADSNSVAIVGNEYMVSKVARAYAARQDSTPQTKTMDDHGSALDWHKARIAYLEGVRADLARQLEHERHDRREECEQLEEECSSRVRAVQAQLAAEREHRVEAEARVRDAFREEAAALASQLGVANERSDDANARCRALEIKVEFLNSERAELLADRDAARALLAAHEGDLDRLEAQLVRLQVQERIGNGLRQASMAIKATRRRALATAFYEWRNLADYERTCQHFLVAGGCRQTAAALSRLRNKTLGGAWSKWKCHALATSSQHSLDTQAQQWERERASMVAQREAVAQDLELAKTRHALRTSTKVIQALQRRGLSMGWRSWVALVAAGREFRQKSALRGSALLSSTTKIRLRCLERNFRKLLLQTTRQAASLAATAIEMKAKVDRNAHRCSTALRTLSAVFSTSTQDQKRLVFARMKHRVAKHTDAKQKLRLLFKNVSGVAVAAKRAALLKWVQTLETQSRAADSQSRGMKLLLRVAMSGAGSLQGKGLRTWMKVTEGLRRADQLADASKLKSFEVMAHASKRKEVALLHGAVTRWHRAAVSITEGKKRCVHVMRSTMLRMLRTQLAKGFAEWGRSVHQAKSKQVLKDRATRAGVSGLRSMRRTVARLTSRHLKRAFDKLVKHSSARAVDLTKKSEAASRLRRCGRRKSEVAAAGAFIKWSRVVVGEKSSARFLRLVLRNWVTRVAKDVVAAFGRWVVCARAEAARVDKAALTHAMAAKLREQGGRRLCATGRSIERRRVCAKWLAWKREAAVAAAAERAQRRFLQIVSAKCEEGQRALVAVAFRRMHRTTAMRGAQNRLAKRVIVRLLRSPTKHAFGLWWDLVEAWRHEEHAREARTLASHKARQSGGVSTVSSVIMRWQSKSIWGAWKKWHKLCFHEYEVARLQRGLAMRRCLAVAVSRERRLQLGGWRRWCQVERWSKDVEALHRRQEAKAWVALTRMASRKVALSWECWQRVIEKSRAVELGLERVTNLVVRSFFSHWSRSAARQKLGQHLGKKVIVSLQRAFKIALTQAWRHWAHTFTLLARFKERHDLEVKHLVVQASQSKVKKVLGRILRLRLWNGFGRWKTVVGEQKKSEVHRRKLQDLVVRRMRLILKGRTGKAWATWRESLVVMELRHSRAALTKHLSEHEVFKGRSFVSAGTHRMHDILTRRSSWALRKRFGCWHRRCILEAHLALRCFGRIAFATTAAAFETWLKGDEHRRRVVSKTKRALAMVRHGLSQASKRSLQRAVFRWRSFSLEKLHYLQRQDSKKKRLAKKTYHAMLNGLVSSGWRQWVAVIAEEKRSEVALRHKHYLLRRVVSAVLSRSRKQALRAWVHFARAESAAAEKKKRVLERLVEGADRALLRAGLTRWKQQVDAWAECDQQRLRCLALLSEASLRNAGAAFRKWKEASKTVGQLRKLLPRILGRLQVTRCRATLTKWYSAARGVERANARARDVNSGVSLLRRTLHGMQRAHLGGAWRAWREGVATQTLRVRRERRLKSIWATLFRRQAVLALSAWRRQSRSWRHKQQQLRRVARKMDRRWLRSAVLKWRALVAAKESYAKEQARHQLLFRRTVNMIGSKKTLLAWRAWTGAVAELRESEAAAEDAAKAVEAQLGVVMNGFIHMVSRQAFRRWSLAVSEVKAAEEAQASYAKERQRSVAVVVRAKAAFMKKDVNKAFRTWHSFALVRHARAQAACGTLLGFHAKARTVRVRWAWRKWGVSAAHASAQAKVLERLVRKNKVSSVRGALVAWRSTVTKGKERSLRCHANGKHMALVLRRLCLKSKHEALNRWKRVNARTKEATRILKRVSRVAADCQRKATRRMLRKGLRALSAVGDEVAARQKAIRRHVTSLVAVLQGKATLRLARAFRTLGVATERRAAATVASSHAASSRSRILKKVYVTRLTASWVACAWRKWVAGIASDDAVARSLRHMRSVLAVVSLRSLTKAWRSWCRFSQGAELELLREKHAKALGASQSAASGFLEASKVLTKSFRSWSRVVRDPSYQDPALKCARLLHHLSLPALTKAKVRALSSWRRFVAKREAAHFESAKKEKLLRRVLVNHMHLRVLSVSFDRWVHRAWHSKEMVTSFSRGLSSLVRTWHAAAAHRSRRAWSRWVAWVRAEATAQEKLRCRLRITMHLVAFHGADVQRGALRQWRSFVEEDKARRDSALAARSKLLHALTRTTHVAPLRRAFNLWAGAALRGAEAERFSRNLTDALEEQKMKLELERKHRSSFLIMQALLSSRVVVRLQKGFVMFHSNVLVSRDQEQTSARQRALLKFIVSGWSKKHTLGAWRTWRGKLESTRVRRRRLGDKLSLCSHYLAEWRNSSLTRALSQWRAQATNASATLAAEHKARTHVVCVGAGAGEGIVHRLFRRRETLWLRGAVDRWFLAVHSPALTVVKASRAAQLLFAVDMRLMQRSLIRWRTLATMGQPLPPSPGSKKSHHQLLMAPSSPPVGSSPSRLSGNASPPSSPLTPYSPPTSPGSPNTSSSPPLPEPPTAASSSSISPPPPSSPDRRRQPHAWLEAEDERRHFRRLLWAHIRNGQESEDWWNVGRASVLAPARHAVTKLLCRRLASRILWAAFATWVEAHHAKAAGKMKWSVRSAGLKLSSRMLQAKDTERTRRAISTWSRNAKDATRAAAASQHACAQQTMALGFVSRWLSRQSKNGAQHAFQKWTTFIDASRQMRQARRSHLSAMERLVRRSAKEQLRRRLSLWGAAVEIVKFEQGRTRRALKRISALLLHCRVKQALNTWRGTTQKVELETKLLRTALNRITLSRVACAWRSWRDVVRLEAAQRVERENRAAAALRFSQRLLRDTESRAFRQWREAAVALAREQRSRAANEEKLGRAFRLVHSALVRKAWTSWRAQVEGLCTLNKVLRRLVRTQRQSTQRTCFQRWQRRCAHSSRERRQFEVGMRVMSRALLSANTKSVAKAVRVWQLATLRMSAATALSEEKRLRSMVARDAKLSKAKKVLAQMSLASVGAAWRTWTLAMAASTSSTMRKRSSARAVSSLFGVAWQRMASRALHTWRLAVFRASAGLSHERSLHLMREEWETKVAAVEEDARRLRLRGKGWALKTLLLITSSVSTKALALAFNSWRAGVAAESLARSEASRIAEMKRKALRTLAMATGVRKESRQLALAWHHWRALSDASTRRRSQFHRYLTECSHWWLTARASLQREALHRWHHTAEQMKGSQALNLVRTEKALVMLASVSRRLLSHVWCHWKDVVVAHTLSARFALQLAKVRLSKSRADQTFHETLSVCRAWRRWCSRVEHEKVWEWRRRGVLRTAHAVLARLFTSAGVGRAYNAWVQFASLEAAAEGKRAAEKSASVLLLERFALGMARGTLGKKWRLWRSLCALQKAEEKAERDADAALKMWQTQKEEEVAELQRKHCAETRARVVARVVARFGIEKTRSCAFARWHRVAFVACREADATATIREMKMRFTFDKICAATSRSSAALNAMSVGVAVRRWVLFAKLSAAVSASEVSQRALREACSRSSLDASAVKRTFAIHRLKAAAVRLVERRERRALKRWSEAARTHKRLRGVVLRLGGGARRLKQALALAKWKQIHDAWCAAERAGSERTSAATQGAKQMHTILRECVRRREARSFRCWHEYVAVSVQREEHVASALTLLREKSLHLVWGMWTKEVLRAKSRALSKWLAALSLDRYQSLSMSLLRVNLRAQCHTSQRFFRRRMEVAFFKWRVNIQALRQAVAFGEAVKVRSSLGRAWRVWISHVWSRRFLLLREALASEALETVSALQALASSELAHIQQTHRALER